MNAKKEALLRSIIRQFAREVDKKFRAGDKEHGGDLMDVDTIREAKAELLDAYVYLCVEERKRIGDGNKK